MINIGVTGTGSLIGQGIIKSLNKSSFKKAINLIGFDYIKETVGSFWCKKNYLLPDIFKKNASKDEWIKKITEILHQEEIKILLIGIDFELPVFAEYKNYIEEKTDAIIMVSNKEVVRIANDKYLTYKFLKKNGLNYPKTYLPEEFNYDLLPFPCVIKPRVGARSVDMYLIKSIKEYKQKIGSIKNPIVQENIGNAEEEYTCGVLRLGNEIVGMIALKRTLKGGNTFKAYYSKDTPQAIYDYIFDVVNILKPFGCCNLQLRIDEKGIPKIFEINARHSGTTYMRSLFGFNEIEHILRYCLNMPQKPFKIREGMAIRYFDEFII